MTDTNEFQIDRPVSGDIQQTNKPPVDQITAKEFLEAVDRVLAVEHVTGLTWDQYTPYFNDGDPCEFSVHEVRVILDNGQVEDGENESIFGEGYTEYRTGYSLAELFERKPGKSYQQTWERDHGPWDDEPRVQKENVSFIAPDGTDLEPVYDALAAFPSAKRWEAVARQSFGDHAEVTATSEGFSVEYYEHD